MTRAKKLISIICMTIVVFTLTGCSALFDLAPENDEVEGVWGSKDDLDNIVVEGANSDLGNRSMVMTLSDTGSLQITRCNEGKNTPMGDDDTWTIFVYLCGSDLESENGMATMDMKEMAAASTDENIKFVIETGGATGWENSVDPDLNQRYLITAGEITLIEENNQAAMNKAKTLERFLDWGIENYPAANMGLVLWNHGGGSIGGVCFDENNEYKSLSLRKMDSALLAISDKLTDKFEFIGFDACLMGTVEVANVVASYANYMYGSQELEAGYGWDYTAIGEFLNKNPHADGKALGKVVAESFYNACKEDGSEDETTFSIIDLSKIDKLMVALNDYCKSVYENSQDSKTMAKIMRKIDKVDNFGGNNQAEGYTNMVDLGGVIEAVKKFAVGEKKINQAINSTVCYKINGAQHSDASGLSIYYPLNLGGSRELTTFSKIAVSPFYLSFIDRMVEAKYGKSDYGNYDGSSVVSNWGDYEYSDSTQEDTDEGDTNEYQYVDDGTSDGNSELITFTTKPGFNENGVACFQLDEKGLENTSSVVASVLWVLDDNYKELADLGEVADLYYDWDTGYVEDLFNGSWYSLLDGQHLCAYYVTSTDTYDVYTAMILLNNEETNLRFRVYFDDAHCELEGVWDGVCDNGMAEAKVETVKPGDVIVPMYFDAYDYDSDCFYGEEYVVENTDFITYKSLSDGEYWFAFLIEDVYGDTYLSDYLTFSIENGEIYYYEDK